MNDLDIPAFLVIPQAERKAAWAGRRVTKVVVKGPDWRLPKSMDAAAKALLREQEAIAEEKKRASLAALKAWKQENRR